MNTRTGYVRLVGEGTESLVTLTQFGAGSKNIGLDIPMATVYPNPSSGMARVEIQAKGLADVTVFDIIRFF